MEKTIGIALATFNPTPRFFEKQIQSLIDQTHSDWICCISDDSPNIRVREYIQEFTTRDPRIQYYQNDGANRGAFYNFENALKHLPNTCIAYAFCDQDDLWLPEKLEKQLQCLNENSKRSLVHSDLILCDEEERVLANSCWRQEGRTFSKKQELRSLVLQNRVTGCACLFSQAARTMALPFPKGVTSEYLHDQWLAGVSLTIGEIFEIPQPLIMYRQHKGNVVGASRSDVIWRAKRTLAALGSITTKAQTAQLNRRRLAQDLISRHSEPNSLVAPRIENASESGPGLEGLKIDSNQIATALKIFVQPKILSLLFQFIKSIPDRRESRVWALLCIKEIFG